MLLLDAAAASSSTITWCSGWRDDSSRGTDDNCFSLTASEILVILWRGQATQQGTQLCLPGYSAVDSILLCCLWVWSCAIGSWKLVPPGDLSYDIFDLELYMSTHVYAMAGIELATTSEGVRHLHTEAATEY